MWDKKKEYEVVILLNKIPSTERSPWFTIGKKDSDAFYTVFYQPPSDTSNGRLFVAKLDNNGEWVEIGSTAATISRQKDVTLRIRFGDEQTIRFSCNGTDGFRLMKDFVAKFDADSLNPFPEPYIVVPIGTIEGRDSGYDLTGENDSFVAGTSPELNGNSDKMPDNPGAVVESPIGTVVDEENIEFVLQAAQKIIDTPRYSFVSIFVMCTMILVFVVVLIILGFVIKSKSMLNVLEKSIGLVKEKAVSQNDIIALEQNLMAELVKKFKTAIAETHPEILDSTESAASSGNFTFPKNIKNTDSDLLALASSLDQISTPLYNNLPESRIDEKEKTRPLDLALITKFYANNPPEDQVIEGFEVEYVDFVSNSASFKKGPGISCDNAGFIMLHEPHTENCFIVPNWRRCDSGGSLRGNFNNIGIENCISFICGGRTVSDYELEGLFIERVEKPVEVNDKLEVLEKGIIHLR